MKITIDQAIEYYRKGFFDVVQSDGRDDVTAQTLFMALRALETCHRYGIDEAELMRGYLYDD